MLTYLVDTNTNKITEFNISLEESKQLIQSGVYRQATTKERVDFIQGRVKQEPDSQTLLEKGLIDVYFHAPEGRKDGYSTVSDFMIKYARQNGVYLNRQYTGQKIGIVYNHPPHIKELKTPYKIIYTGFESTKVPEDWLEYLNQADEIWTFSKFCQKAFCDTFNFEKSRIKVFPHGYDADAFPLLKREHHDVFTFLHYDAFKLRKGWDLVVDAFERAFNGNPKVKLILKTAKEKALPLDYPNVEIRKGGYSQPKLLELLKEADCFVFPSRGEGYGMTPLEALSTGIPVIVTDKGGMTEYNKDVITVKSTPIKAFYENYKGDLGEMYQADVVELAEKMKQIYAEKPQTYAKYNKIATKYQASKLLKPMWKHIKEVDKNVRINKNFVQLSIIVLTYNALEWTKKCLESIILTTKVPYELIVIDNNSNDDTQQWLLQFLHSHKNLPIRIILNADNRGVAGGRNQGIEASKGIYCVFLDNDVEVFNGWDERILNHFRLSPEIGVVGQGGNFVDNFAPLAFRVPHRHLEIQHVDVVAGYCFAFPKRIINLIGNQYEGLGKFWHEDLEFCTRVKRYGMRIIEDRGIPLVHHAHKSAGENIHDHKKVKQIHNGFDEKAKKVGERLVDSNILTIFRGDNDPHSAYTIIADNLTKYLRDLGVVVFRKNKLYPDGTNRSRSFDLCNGFDMTFNGKPLVYLHQENDISPKAWVKDMDLVDFAFVCSDFSYRSLIAGGMPKEKLINQSLSGFDENTYNFEAMRLPDESLSEIGLDTHKFTFVTVGASQPRKGTDILIQAFCEEFGKDEPVQLLIKNYNYGKQMWVIEEIAKYTDRPKIIPVYEDWDASFIARLYKTLAPNGAYIQPHRAEGFGMTQREALACGLRVGTTKFGGTSDLKNLAYLFDYQLVDSTFHNNEDEPFYEAEEMPSWAEPNIADVRRFMRHLYQECSYNEARAKEISDEVIGRFGFRQVAIDFYRKLMTYDGFKNHNFR